MVLTGASDGKDITTAINAGVYVLVLEFRDPVRVRVGALGFLHFEAGSYLYVGSARRNLRQRVARHLAVAKRVRWHIDYLTTHPGVRVVGAVMVQNMSLTECNLAKKIGLDLDGTVPVPAVGMSDCRNRCPAHLWWRRRPTTLDEVVAVLPGLLVVVVNETVPRTAPAIVF